MGSDEAAVQVTKGLVLFGAEGQRFVQLGLFIFGFFCQLRRERVLHA